MNIRKLHKDFRSVGGGGEIVFNYNTGEVSAFAFGGSQWGWNGGVSGSISTAFIHNLGDKNSNYSGPFTGLSFSVPTPIPGVGAGATAAATSEGASGPLKIDPKGAYSQGISIGGALAGKYGGGFSVTRYSKPFALGNFLYNPLAPGVSPIDYAMYLLRRPCN
ncbi:MAG: hypothetical protein LAO78_28765 [Acidobacteriia bacterium]|nr:hypothetical protein [Terriglobia bacterium]